MKAHSEIQSHEAKSLSQRVSDFIRQRGLAAEARLAGKLFSIGPNDLANLGWIGAEHIAHGITDFAEWTAKMRGEFGLKNDADLNDVWDASNKAVDDAIRHVAGESRQAAKMSKTVAEREAACLAIIKNLSEGGTGSITPHVQNLARLYVRQGVVEFHPLIDAVHHALQQVMPDITREETMEAFSGYQSGVKSSTIGQLLLDLHKAKVTGAITDAEFQAQKAKILGNK